MEEGGQVGQAYDEESMRGTRKGNMGERKGEEKKSLFLRAY